MLRARVAEGQLAPAATAAEQACQQSVAVLGRAMMAAGGNVAAHHLADRLSFLPAGITLIAFGINASRPIEVVVLNCWVTETNETPWPSNNSTSLAKSAS
jgi:hypothetical protein